MYLNVKMFMVKKKNFNVKMERTGIFRVWVNQKLVPLKVPLDT